MFISSTFQFLNYVPFGSLNTQSVFLSILNTELNKCLHTHTRTSGRLSTGGQKLPAHRQFVGTLAQCVYGVLLHRAQEGNNTMLILQTQGQRLCNVYSICVLAADQICIRRILGENGTALHPFYRCQNSL
jgi:hypothetical protein